MDTVTTTAQQLDTVGEQPAEQPVTSPLEPEAMTPQEFYRRITARLDIRAILTELADRPPRA